MEMTTKEFGVLVATMRSVYVRDFIPDEDSFKVWYMLLRDIPYEVASLAVQKYMSVNKYPPTPADIRESAAEIITPKSHTLSDIEAWNLVRKAMKNGLYGAEKEYDALPEPVQKAIGSPSYLRSYAMDSNFNEGVAQSNFLKSYRIILQREKDSMKLPSQLRQRIMEIQASMAPTAIEDKSV